MTEIPRHCGPGMPFRCGCLEEAGTWYPCIAHAAPHSLHATPAPGCDRCDDLMDEAREVLAEVEYDDLDDCA